MKISQGNTLTVIAPKEGFVRDVPVVYGNLLIVPTKDAIKNESVSVNITGLFDRPLKEGDTPAFKGEYAYFEKGVFTTSVPTANPKVPVGVFVDGGVLLTGEMVG